MPRGVFFVRNLQKRILRTKKTTLMRAYKKQHEVCNECEQEFIDEMNRLVGTVDGYSPRSHSRKEQEVKTAFGQRRKVPAEQ